MIVSRKTKDTVKEEPKKDILLEPLDQVHHETPRGGLDEWEVFRGATPAQSEAIQHSL